MDLSMLTTTCNDTESKWYFAGKILVWSTHVERCIVCWSNSSPRQQQYFATAKHLNYMLIVTTGSKTLRRKCKCVQPRALRNMVVARFKMCAPACECLPAETTHKASFKRNLSARAAGAYA